MRRAAKKDDNHNEIKQFLLKAGFSVFDTHMVGHDFPDMVVAFSGETAVVEVKTKTGKLTTGQLVFKKTWSGKHIVAKSGWDVLKAFNIDVM